VKRCTRTPRRARRAPWPSCAAARPPPWHGTPAPRAPPTRPRGRCWSARPRGCSTSSVSKRKTKKSASGRCWSCASAKQSADSTWRCALRLSGPGFASRGFSSLCARASPGVRRHGRQRSAAFLGAGGHAVASVFLRGRAQPGGCGAAGRLSRRRRGPRARGGAAGEHARRAAARLRKAKQTTRQVRMHSRFVTTLFPSD
jgi:hypothetical protein